MSSLKRQANLGGWPGNHQDGAPPKLLLLGWEFQPQRLGLDVFTLVAHPLAASPLERFLKNRPRGRQATRTLATAFPNSTSHTPPGSAAAIRADVRAYTPARDGGLREKSCSTAFPGQPARAEPSRLGESSGCDHHGRRALRRASLRQAFRCSERRSRTILRGPAAACSARG